MIQLINGQIFTPNGQVERADITIDGDRIQAIGDAPTGPTDQIVDCSGCTILPGLIDMHSHLSGQPLGEFATWDTAEAALVASRSALQTLRSGTTTVRELGSYEHLDFLIRAKVRAGALPGPSILASGKFIAMTGGHGYNTARVADGADEVRRAVREQIAGGADWIKLMCSGGLNHADELVDAQQFSDAEIRAAVEEASAAGKQVAVHAHPARAIQAAVRLGARSVEHGSYLDEETAEVMIAAGSFLVPTLAIYDYLAFSDEYPQLSEPALAMLDRKLASFDLARSAGVAWGVGSDGGGRLPNFSMLDEIRILTAKAGVPIAEALVGATATNAALLGLPDVGRIAVGHQADLIVVRGNPLDDVEVLANVWQTICRGQAFDWERIGDEILGPRIGRYTD